MDTSVVDQGVQDKEGAVDMIVQPANYGHLEVSNSWPELHPFSMPGVACWKWRAKRVGCR